MSFDWAAGRLIKLRERKRREQLIAASLLCLCNGDGGLEGLFGGGRVRRIALEQDCAADAVKHGVGPVLSGLACQRERFVYLTQGAVLVIPFGFELGEQALENWRIELVSLAEIRRHRFPESLHSAFVIAEPGAHPI